MPAKYFSIQALGLRRVEVARDDQHGVVRRVERLEELLHVGDGGRVEVCEVAVEIVGVVPVLVRGHRQVDPREPAVRLVQHVDAHLALDDLLLVLQVLRADVEAAHAVGLRPEHGLEHVRRNDLEVVREVEPRGSVEQAAVRLDEPDELHLSEIGGALEHHVLEQVREPGAVLRLVPEADVVVHGHRHRRRRRVAREHDLEAVRQLVVLTGTWRRPCAGGGCAWRAASPGANRSATQAASASGNGRMRAVVFDVGWAARCICMRDLRMVRGARVKFSVRSGYDDCAAPVQTRRDMNAARPPVRPKAAWRGWDVLGGVLRNRRSTSSSVRATAAHRRRPTRGEEERKRDTWLARTSK